MSNKALQILLVEDSKHDSRFLTRALARSDLTCKVTWVMRGEEALEKIKNQSFDVGLIDFHLPGWSGMETSLANAGDRYLFPDYFCARGR